MRMQTYQHKSAYNEASQDTRAGKHNDRALTTIPRPVTRQSSLNALCMLFHAKVAPEFAAG